MSVPPLIIRADGNVHIGTGHVMRCYALAQACRSRGVEPTIACSECPPSLQARIEQEGFDFVTVDREPGSAEDASATVDLAEQRRSDWIVLDGYHFDLKFQRQVRSGGHRLLLIDDYAHLKGYAADVLLNQNILAARKDYLTLNEDCRMLLGPDYALLRREFWSMRFRDTTNSPPCTRIVVSFGGSDSENVTGLVLRALAGLNKSALEMVVLMGGANPHVEEVSALVQESGLSCRMVTDPENVATWFAQCDVAIAAGGSTCWELMLMGIPAFLITVARNQERIAEGLHAYGAAVRMGRHDEIDASQVREILGEYLCAPDRLRLMSNRGRQLVDGQGALRVASVFQTPLQISFVCDRQSWISPHIQALAEEMHKQGHTTTVMHDPQEVKSGDMAFFLSCSHIVDKHVLDRNVHNIVVHASDLPRGKGWSPLTWQILNGDNVIPITLFEAKEHVDSGPIYLQDFMRFEGHELIDELRGAVVEYTLRMCREFVDHYPFLVSERHEQSGKATFYKRRTAAASQLDPNRSIEEQFDLLRVVDNENYPAFFHLRGNTYTLAIQKANDRYSSTD